MCTFFFYFLNVLTRAPLPPGVLARIFRQEFQDGTDVFGLHTYTTCCPLCPFEKYLKRDLARRVMMRFMRGSGTE